MGGIIREPKVGDTVLYRVREGRAAKEDRPAIVVKVYSANTVGLHVFSAGIKDSDGEHAKVSFTGYVDSVPRGENAGEWRWQDA